MARQPKIARVELDLYVAAAALLSSQGKQQDQISTALKISQPEVSRLLSLAEAKKWRSRPYPSFNRDAVDADRPGLRNQVEQHLFSSNELQEKIDDWSEQNQRSCKVHIVEGDDEDQFGRNAAVEIAELISRKMLVGILWGRTLEKIVNSIADRSAEIRAKAEKCQFIPLCGEPVFLENLSNLDLSASSLASRLEKAINGRQSTGHSLNAVPAYISKRFTQIRAVKEFIVEIPGYKAIFGKATGVVKDLGAVISGIGVIQSGPDEKSGTFLQERVEQGEISMKELDKLVLGDLGGILIPRKAANLKRINALNRGLTGILEYHLAKVAEAANPGVIVVANKPVNAKALLAKAIVEKGLVNHLIISRALADGLTRLGEKE